MLWWMGRAGVLLAAVGMMSLYLLAAVILPALVQRFVQYDFTTCTGITLDARYAPRDVSVMRPTGAVRLVPVDIFPVSTVQGLASHYQAKYGIDVEVAPPLATSADAFDHEREQWVSDGIIDALRTDHPQPSTGRLIVIGFLEQDMSSERVLARLRKMVTKNISVLSRFR